MSHPPVRRTPEGRSVTSGLTRRAMFGHGAGLATIGLLGSIASPQAVAAPPRRVAIPPRSEDVVYASDFGYDPTDSTATLQAALDADASTVVIDDPGGTWLTGPLYVNRDGVSIIVAPGVVVRALPGGYPEQRMCLLNIIGRTGVSVIGYGATMIMNKAEYGHDGQWRHVINIMSGRSVLIEGLRLAESGGDGIYVGKSQVPGDPHHSADIVVRNVTCDANYRQGMSIVGVAGLLAEGCRFSNTLGHNPQAGVDIEPNDADQPLTGIVLRDCVLEGNQSYQMVVSLTRYDATSPALDILLDRCRLGGADGQERDLPVFLYNGSASGTLSGRVEIRDSLLQAGPYAGCWGSWNQDGVDLVLTRTVCQSWEQPASGYPALSIRAFDPVPYVGGVRFTGVGVYRNVAEPALTFITRGAVSPDLGVHDVHGSLTVVNPEGAVVDLGPDATDITLTIHERTQVPDTVVGISAAVEALLARQPIRLTVERQSSDLSAPLAVRYRVAGQAVERQDVYGTPGVVVIPAGESSATVRVRTLPTAAGASVTFTLEPDLGYTVGPEGEATVTIS
ncbi:hypothetical protein [Microlunatus sp. Y2014]|uniref:hypothetical protein n=1 Tax=Microlunatus sp. Y2014 TaxID=3418488 RepID=UPI003DA72DC6